MLQCRDLLAHGRTALAAGYLTASVGAGLIAVWLGLALARAAVTRAVLRKRRRAA